MIHLIVGDTFIWIFHARVRNIIVVVTLCLNSLCSASHYLAHVFWLYPNSKPLPFQHCCGV